MITGSRMNSLGAIIYRKPGKYRDVDERSGMVDIFQLITGLKVSTGVVIFSRTHIAESQHADGDIRGAVFVDSRYTLAAKLNLKREKFDICDLNTAAIVDWINKNLDKNNAISYDPRFFTKEYVWNLKTKLGGYKFNHIDIEDVLAIPSPKRTLQIHDIDRIFQEDKYLRVYQAIEKNSVDAYLITDPCTISWLLDIRDLNSGASPVVFGYLLVTKDRELTLYIDEIYESVPNNSEYSFDIKFEKDLCNDIKKYNHIGIDESETPSHISHPNFINIKNPCALQKSTKNSVEISDMKLAAIKDSAAIIHVLHWLQNRACEDDLTELDVAKKLLDFRKLDPDFICESFSCISAADTHSSIIHYSPTEQSNINIKNILLLDSGGQYKYGTTDITRTVCMDKPTKEQKKYYTLVLKGHIAVANAKIPVGYSGAVLDAFARQFLWKYSADYGHSTGHGIGYMSHVHEGPISISRSNNIPLKAGMILSNEPGYYEENNFGIRLENMILVEEDCNFLTFETISLVPFDLNFIDSELLTTYEISWITRYHGRIVDTMKNHLDDSVFQWLNCFIQ
jgi:Xaa-Pro aminopeptidase